MNYKIGVDAAWEHIGRGDNVFITGGGGVGKSYLIRQLMDTMGSTVVVSPTGVSAANIGAVTIHSFFGLRLDVFTGKSILKKDKRSLLRAIETLIIDEISAVRCDKFYEIDYLLKRAKGNNLPFGGVQVVVVGDGLQLSPFVNAVDKIVYEENYNQVSCIGSLLWYELNFVNIILKKIHRQKDNELIKNLNLLRIGENKKDVCDFFNSRCLNKTLEDSIMVCTTNRMAEEINRHNYEANPNPAKLYKSKKVGVVPQKLVPDSNYLKRGEKVIVVANEYNKNDKTLMYYNGLLGTIIDLYPEAILIKTNTGEEVTIYNKRITTLEYYEEEGQLKQREIGEYIFMPLLPAYAFTIHKCQGLTLDKICVDLGTGAFTNGQTYVALSRATTVDGISLMNNLTISDIKVDSKMVEFYNRTFGKDFLLEYDDE